MTNPQLTSRWSKNFNVRPQTIKLLEENIGKSLQGLDLGKDFMSKTSKSGNTNKSRQMRL